MSNCYEKYGQKTYTNKTGCLNKIGLLFCCLLISLSLFAQDAAKSYVSSDKAFTISYPENWKVNKDRNLEFSIYQPGTGIFPVMVKVEIKKKAEGYENADIHQISDAELKMIKSDQNLNPEILDSRFREQNDHEWWIIHSKVKSLGKEYPTDTYKTIHNGKVYVFTYQSNEKNYEKNKAVADKIIASVEFLTKNETPVNIQTAKQEPKKPVTDANKAAANTSLSPLVTKAETDSNLGGKEPNRQVEVVNHATQTIPKATPTQEIVAKEPETGEKTFDNSDDAEIHEPENIKKYGNGKVRSLPNGKYEITLPDNKKIQIDPYGTFVGYEPITNCYVFLNPEEGYVLISRTTGETLAERISINPKDFSPDKKWIANVIPYDQMGITEGVVLYSVSENLKKVFEKKIKNINDQQAKIYWIDNNTVQVKKEFFNVKTLKSNVTGNYFWLTLKNGNWITTTTKPAIKPVSETQKATNAPVTNTGIKTLNTPPKVAVSNKQSFGTSPVFTGRITKR